MALIARRCAIGALPSLLLAAAVLPVRPAWAQRTDDNAVTAASDAFGNTVGFQTIGLYSPTNARGFNPTQAENLRIEGLYYDQQISFSSPFLFSRSDMRVGIAAQSFSFPSPTGIVDYTLRKPGDRALVSALLTRGPLNMATAELDIQYPLIADVVSVGASVVDWSDFDYNFARTSALPGATLVLRIRPGSGSEIVPFVGYTHGDEQQELPTVYANGIDVPPRFEERQLAAQDWTSWGWDQLTAGVIARSTLGESWRLAGGVFRSLARNAQNFNDLLLGPAAGGVAKHIVDVTQPLRAGSYSGDLRLVRATTDGPHARELTFDVRGRSVVRNFGGDVTVKLGSVPIDGYGAAPAPPLPFSAQSRDEVRQIGVGASYNERWRGVGTLSLGVLATDYRRSLDIPVSGRSAEHASKILPTVSFTGEVARHVTAYASYTRGLEDSGNAPTTASNAGEPPPATPTWQVDGGLRLTPRGDLQLLLGVFRVHKGYFNLDDAGRYRQLGDLSSRGLEGSATLTGRNGLTVVAGLVVLRPEIARQKVAASAVGTVPVGPVPRTINFNADFAPPRWGRWGAALQWTSLSSRVVTANDQSLLPPMATLTASVRYKVRLFDRPCSARLDIANLTNQYGQTVSAQYAVFPVLRRNYSLTLATDI